MNSIRLLSDGTLLSDSGGAFGLVPRSKWSKVMAADEKGRLPQVLWTPLIFVDGIHILVDCGCGDKYDSLFEFESHRTTQLEQLAQLGLTPEDIGMVVLTHLHGDHSGWCTRKNGPAQSNEIQTSALVPTYPNAKYFVQRTEYEDAVATNERTRNTYFADNFVPLSQAGVLTLLDGPCHLTQNVQVVLTPGHTAGHQSLIVAGQAFGQDEPPVLILGELATYMIQFERLPWVTAYDVLPMRTIESKRAWQGWAQMHGATLICSHEPITPVGSFRNSGEYSKIIAVQRDYIVV